jgi:hypothetical protein
MTPEFLLTAACSRWPPSESRNAAVRSGAKHITDWNAFLQVVGRQRVVGLVHGALLSSGIELSSVIAERLASQAQFVARNNLILAAETTRLQRAFDVARIPMLVLKGAALAQLAYGSPTAKQTRDIDVLVAPESAEAAMQLLECEGYALSYPGARLSEAQLHAVFRYAREVQFKHRDKKFLLEMKWRCVSNPLLLKGVDVHSPTQNVTLSDGISVRTLAADDLIAYLCVHGAQHAWSRLKWLADLNALASVNTDDIVGRYHHAQRIGAGHCAGQALLLCHRLLDLNIPPGLEEEIRSHGRSERLVRVAMKTMADTYAEAEPGRGSIGQMRVLLAQFLLGDGLAFFWAECRTATVRILDLVDLPLPPGLQFLYPLLRLPLWLWRLTVAGLRTTSPPD